LRLYYIILLVLLLAAYACHAAPSPKASATLWQLPEQTQTQMMSYVIRTTKGRVVVIDGGTYGDAPYLKAFLKKNGGRVEAWFITHPHTDHCSALAGILTHPEGIAIGRMYASLPKVEWVRDYEPYAARTLEALNEAASGAKKCFAELVPGEVLDFDEVRIEVLAVKNPEIHTNALNNSSVALRMQDPTKSVLFLGDLGPEAGEKLLASKYAKRLRADYVQMAHHGQQGVTEEFYKAVSPSYCLWTTPEWLWENDQGDGPGTGPWKTLEVRAWMEKMPVKRHYVTWIDGLVEIR